MKLRKLSPHLYEGTYRGYHLEIRHLAHGVWVAWIDGQAEHFASLDHARRECRRVLDYAEPKKAHA